MQRCSIEGKEQSSSREMAELDRNIRDANKMKDFASIKMHFSKTLDP